MRECRAIRSIFGLGGAGTPPPVRLPEMGVTTPILVGEANAARLLDLKTSEFRALVNAGHLPRGRAIAPGLDRWLVEELRTIACGEAADGMSGVTW